MRITLSWIAGLFGLMLSINSVADNNPHDNSLSPMLKFVMPTVVNISAQGTAPWPKNPGKPQNKGLPRLRHFQQSGSGVIVSSKNGLILTNAHVIHNTDTIIVTLNHGRHLIGKLLGEDRGTDLAVIKVNDKHLHAIKIGNSNNVQVGDFVTAIGNPFGLHQSVTSGIISGLHRRIGIDGFENFIQTDAPINPGNSGGALVNTRGELIGINTAILATSGGNLGIGFAIPINMANQIAKQLIEYGKVERGLLGVVVQDLNPLLADAMHVPNAEGAVVNEIVPDSAAAKAGIKLGDIITRINQTSVESANQVRSMVGIQRANSKIKLYINRQGKQLVKTATIKPRQKANHQDTPHGVLSGLQLADFDQLDPKSRHVRGVQVLNVTPGCQAWLGGIQPGDVILTVNNTAVHTLDKLLNVIKKHADDQYLLMVDRNHNHVYVVLS